MVVDRLLSVRTVPGEDREDLLAGLHGPERLAWARRGMVIGRDTAAVVSMPAGPGRCAAAERMLRALFDAAETEDHVGAKFQPMLRALKQS